VSGVSGWQARGGDNPPHLSFLYPLILTFSPVGRREKGAWGEEIKG